MEAIIYVRRTNGRFTRKEPTLKLEVNGNRFILNEKAQENTRLKHNDGVMFGFNYKLKRAYIYKDGEPDAFVLRQKSKTDNGLRFTSKDLANYFIKCFGLDKGKSNYFFVVAENRNDKGAFLLTHK